MTKDRKVSVAIVGLGFGAEFVPIYQRHPNADLYAICRRDRKALDECGDRFGVEVRYTDYQQLLADPNAHAVHINSPIADHAPQSIAALRVGKHVASTVPAATTIDECREIVEEQRRSRKVYMMMETVVYSREYLFAKELYDRGELGRIQFLRGSHQQDMEGWPDYWEGFPPMHCATHCVSPCLALMGKHAEHVVRHGSGRIDETLIPKYGSRTCSVTRRFSRPASTSMRRSAGFTSRCGRSINPAPLANRLQTHPHAATGLFASRLPPKTGTRYFTDC